MAFERYVRVGLPVKGHGLSYNVWQVARCRLNGRQPCKGRKLIHKAPYLINLVNNGLSTFLEDGFVLMNLLTILPS
jgi:hypothetical protein